MGAIFKTELHRFWRLGLGVFIFHLGVQYYLYYMDAPFIAWPLSQMWLLVSSFSAAGLGVLQMWLHKRPNDWLYLLQRPLSHRRLFVSLAGAGTVILCFVLGLPPLVILVVLQTKGLVVIETRHYLMIPYMLAPALSMYFCACFTILNPNRLAVLALALPTVLINVYPGSGLLLIVNAVLVVAVTFVMALSTFKPDTAQPVNNLPGLLTEIPVQYGALWGLVMVIMFGFELNRAIGGNPQSNPPQNTDTYVLRLTGQERMHYALARSDHPDAVFLDQQVNLGEASAVTTPRINPKRFELPFRQTTLMMPDPEHNAFWSFSHAEMLFEGRDPDTGEHVGWLGPDGFTAGGIPDDVFSSVPWISNSRFILNEDNLWLVDLERQLLHHRYSGSAGDPFFDSMNVGENITSLQSDKYLWIFNTADLNNENTKLYPDAVLELPVFDDPGRHFYTILELINGYLVSALVNFSLNGIARDFALFDNSTLLLYRVGHGEPQELVSRVPLETGFSPFFIYNSLVFSPGMRLLTDLYWGVRLDKSLVRTLPVPFHAFPAGIIFLTLACSMLSGAITFLLVRRTVLPQRAKGFWIVFNTFMGATGLLVFLLGHYWRRTDQLLPVPDKP